MKNIEEILRRIIREQAEPEQPEGKKETDNAPKDATETMFTPAEERFLGKFDAYGTDHIGIIYSPSDIGVREFIARSGADLNLSPRTLLRLIRKKIVKIVPYTGFGRNTDYTIELQLSLNAVKGLAAKSDKDTAEKGSSASGAPTGGGAMPPPPGPEVAWVVRYGDILKESANIAKQLLTEKTGKRKNVLSMTDIAVNHSRVLKRLPKGYVYQLERIIDMIDKKTKNTSEKQRIIADILDTLQLTLQLDPKDIRKSYDFHRTQKRLQKELEKNK